MPVFDTTRFVINSLQPGEDYTNAQILSDIAVGSILKVGNNGIFSVALPNIDYLKSNNAPIVESVFGYDGAQFVWIKQIPTDANYILTNNNVNITNGRVLQTGAGLSQTEDVSTKSITILLGTKLQSLYNFNTTGIVTYDPIQALFVNRAIISSTDTINIVNPTGLGENIDINVEDDTSIQKTTIILNEDQIGSRSKIRFIDSSSVGATIVENVGDNSIDITLSTGAIILDSERGATIVGGIADWEVLPIGPANTYAKSNGVSWSWEALPVLPDNWNFITSASYTLAVNIKNVIDFSGGVCVLTLPENYSRGDSFRIVGYSNSGWQLNLSGSQQIIFGNKSTSLGDAGSLRSTLGTDAIELVAYADNGALIGVSGGTLELL